MYMGLMGNDHLSSSPGSSLLKRTSPQSNLLIMHKVIFYLSKDVSTIPSRRQSGSKM